ncbi:NADPH-dependent FMN reductase [Pusillimonas noertemannii]|uniref:NAD(P)H-dependent FMN reductase n=1 Tax=Pusillimonas noertemannii TaxID=305977 RepID=A0A2U1CRC0_9BURK|nr:NAD(P)H-dependent oxidoreductase [Pusillimonas noertemannii]NYT67777.1 NAD(P)H-dependent oxidoreductase [Pusillimonas noertemannii]PVY68447.1 NAD(P)H-dependent FMN reductase [Pusillimonas noertemannii]TFL12072.1 NADPH-dependent oxidoreductase [Pusillimonas noertemannii]
MDKEAPLIVGIGGTMRPGSTSEMALAAALKMAREMGARTQILSGAALLMDAYEPGATARSEKAGQLVAALRQADGVLISSPSYHGSISGMLKNAIDYTEDMRADERPYLDGRAVGCIVCADGAQAMGSTLFTLRSIIHALRGWPTPYAAALNSAAKPFGPAGEIKDENVEKQLQMMVSQVVGFAQREHTAGGLSLQH